MQLCDFLKEMEKIAPAALALDFDNVGLLIGPEKTEISRVLVALDCTPAVAAEAVEMGADLVLTHHPLFFRPVQRFLPQAPETAAAYTLIRNGIGLFSAHTNYDAANGGVNDCLAELFALRNVEPMPPENMGRIGNLAMPLTVKALCRKVEQILQTRVRFTGNPERTVQRIAVLGGAGGSDIEAAKAAGADVYLTGELKHNQALDADVIGLSVIEAGHYETECIALETLIKRLQVVSNHVEYKLSMCERSPLRALDQGGIEQS